MFTDKIDIEVKAGKGGDGKLSFRHEKYVARGGPDGGDGGHGGDVVFAVDHNLNTLSYFRGHRKIEAESGHPGQQQKRHGKKGESITVKVPPGTSVFQGDKLIADMTSDGQETVIAKGGQGGFGNAHFASSIRQAPRISEKGEPGETKALNLELKLVADVGLVGLPNSGKSTLLSVISNAKPEIADYPFTTLVPNLGVVDVDDESFVAADIPGLIEGASQGKGLGDEFLRHIERTAMIWHLVDSGSDDPAKDYKTINAELGIHSKEILSKPQIVVLTKTDTVDTKDIKLKTVALKKSTKKPVVAISSVAHKGLEDLLRLAKDPIMKARKERQNALANEIPVIDESTLDDEWKVEKKKNAYVVTGTKIEKFAQRTDFSQPDSVARFRNIMTRQGISEALEKQGIEYGNIVRIGSAELEWV